MDDAASADQPLAGVRVVTLAPNLPGPAAAARLRALGATVTKVEPPAGDLLAAAAPAYYADLAAGQEVLTLDLKAPEGMAHLWSLLQDADLLLTSSRPVALARLGLDWATLQERAPRLSQVAIVGHPGEEADLAGHDLTYQAGVGTLQPPRMPSVPVADLAGAERAVGDALAALHAVSRSGVGVYREVALSDVAADLAAPVRHGLTTSGGFLGGALTQYAIYDSADGHVALAALEGHFWSRLLSELDVSGERQELAEVLRGRTSADWQAWARERDLPLAAVVPPAALAPAAPKDAS